MDCLGSGGGSQAKMPAALAPSEGQLVHASTHPQWLPVIDGSWGRMGGGLLRVHLGSASPSPCLCPSVPEGHLSWRMRALLLHELRVRSCPQVLGVRTWACRPGWGAPINPHRCVSLPNFTQVGHVAQGLGGLPQLPGFTPLLHSTLTSCLRGVRAALLRALLCAAPGAGLGLFLRVEGSPGSSPRRDRLPMVSL